MANKFVISVADVYLYDRCDSAYIDPVHIADDYGTYLSTSTAMLTAKTLTDSSIETTISNADTRGGFGNQLLNVYYHSAEMTINFTDAKFNMSAIAALVGDTAYVEGGAANENIITILAGYVPKSVHAVIVAKLAGELSTGCTGVIGALLIDVPLVQLDGGVSISMTADGVATTPFKGRALAYMPDDLTETIYAQIQELGLPTVGTIYHLISVASGDFVANAYYLPESGAKYYDVGADKIYTYTQGSATPWGAGVAPTATPTHGTAAPTGGADGETYVQTGTPTSNQVTFWAKAAGVWATTGTGGASAATAPMELATAWDTDDTYYQKFEITFAPRS